MATPARAGNFSVFLGRKAFLHVARADGGRNFSGARRRSGWLKVEWAIFFVPVVWPCSGRHPLPAACLWLYRQAQGFSPRRHWNDLQNVLKCSNGLVGMIALQIGQPQVKLALGRLRI